MAYTDTWNEAQPLGGDPANTAAADFRALKLDIRERLNSILGVAIGTALADPVTSSPNNLAALTALNPLQQVQTYKKYLSPLDARLYWDMTVAAADMSAYGSSGILSIVTPPATRFSAYWDIDLPVGVTITDVSVRWGVSAGVVTYDMNLLSKVWNDASGPTTVVGLTGYQIPAAAETKSLGAVNSVTVDGSHYYLRWNNNTGNGAANTITMYGIRITYTSPTANTRR